MSSDGIIQTVIANYSLYNSFDNGNTFSVNNSINTYFSNLPADDGSVLQAITMDASGIKQAVCLFNGSILYSVDSGITWKHSNAPPGKWFDIKMSPNALISFAANAIDKIYYSKDNGATWLPTNSGVNSWHNICFNYVTENSINMFVTTKVGIYRSTDGINFTLLQNTSNIVFYGIAITTSLAQNESIIVACAYKSSGNNNDLFISYNNGISWNARKVNKYSYLDNIAMNSDGSVIYMGSNYDGTSYIGIIYQFENDYLIFPTNLPSNISGYLFASSSDGTYVTAVNKTNVYNSNFITFFLNNSLLTLSSSWQYSTMNSKGDIQLIGNSNGLYK